VSTKTTKSWTLLGKTRISYEKYSRAVTLQSPGGEWSQFAVKRMGGPQKWTIFALKSLFVGNGKGPYEENGP
jgi:hypothetical protein